jgi:hypothetical protein
VSSTTYFAAFSIKHFPFSNQIPKISLSAKAIISYRPPEAFHSFPSIPAPAGIQGWGGVITPKNEKTLYRLLFLLYKHKIYATRVA